MTKAFETSAQVRFAHVDPAGIVFYPRYFEMLNGAVEDWCEVVLGADFHELHIVRRVGVPTVKLSVEFSAPSVLGDRLTISVLPMRLGRSSCDLDIRFTCRGELRLHAQVVLVCMDLTTHRATPWPDDVRSRIVEGLAQPA